jgi:hypothetical protein
MDLQLHSIDVSFMLWLFLLPWKWGCNALLTDLAGNSVDGFHRSAVHFTIGEVELWLGRAATVPLFLWCQPVPRNRVPLCMTAGGHPSGLTRRSRGKRYKGPIGVSSGWAPRDSEGVRWFCKLRDCFCFVLTEIEFSWNDCAFRFKHSWIQECEWRKNSSPPPVSLPWATWREF